MDKHDRIEKLQEAQEKIEEAVSLIEDALRETDMADQADAYIIGHLNSWAHGDNPYDRTAIPRLIEDMEARKNCDMCGEENHEDDLEEVDGKYLCPDCVEKADKEKK